MSNVKFKNGIWTPNAQVVCYDCHGNKFPDTRRMEDGTFDFGSRSYGQKTWDELRGEHEMDAEKDVTNCDKCGCLIQIYDSIAMEHNLMNLLKAKGIDAYMEQTGGMNSACGIKRKGECTPEGWFPYYWVTYNFDGDNKYWICRYDAHGEWDEDFGDSFDKIEEVVEFITKLDVEMIKDGNDN